MKKVFSGRVKVILIAALAVALIAAVSSAVMLGKTPLTTNGLGVVLSPFRAVASAVAEQAERIYSYINDYEALKTENQLLKMQLSDLQQEMRDSQEANSENVRLRQLLGLKEKRRDFVFELASVTAWDSSNWGSSFTLDKGTLSGVETGMCVVTADGAVVGAVTEAGLNWASVTTLLDVSTELGAVVSRTGDVGVAQGEFELMKQGQLRLSYIPSSAELRNGDQILTTGGDVYPKGMVLGLVTDVRIEDSGASSYAVVAPAADYEALTQVFIITSYDVEE